MGKVRLAAGDLTAEVNAASGGRLASFRAGRFELLGRVGPLPYEWGSFVMAPYAGRVRNGLLQWQGRTHLLPVNDPPHAMHGLVLDRPWQVAEADATAVTLRCDLDERWPWPAHVTQRIALRPDGLDARIEVHADEREMPAWCGWHPWFHRSVGHGEPVRIDLTAAGMHRRDEAGIATRDVLPVPPGPWDDTFTGVEWPVTLTWPGAFRLEISADTGYAVLFDRKRTVVCIEPQTSPPDGVALDTYSLVSPGTPLIAEMHWTITPDDQRDDQRGGAPAR